MTDKPADYTVGIEIVGDTSGLYFVNRFRELERTPANCKPMPYLAAIQGALRVHHEGLRRQQHVIARAVSISEWRPKE